MGDVTILMCIAFLIFFLFFLSLSHSKERLPTTTALSSDQLLKLATCLEKALSAAPPALPSVTEAFAFMGHLIVAFLTYLLPQRSQVLKLLKLGDTMVKEADGVWAISAAAENTKNKMALASYRLPPLVSNWVDVYITCYRPILLTSQVHDHRHVFVTFTGEGPRTDLHVLVKSVVRACLGVDISPHQFRAVVATCLYEEGRTTIRDLQAVARSMLTSTETLLKHYIRVHPRVDYSRAQGQLDSVLGKRARPQEEEEEEDGKENVTDDV